MERTIASGHLPDPAWIRQSPSAEVPPGAEFAVLKLFVEGKPVPKARPRVVRNRDTGTSWTFTPEATRSWEQIIAYEVKAQLLRLSTLNGPEIRLPFEKRVSMDLWFWFHKPKSYPKSLTDHLKKPDLDNLTKSVLDALEGGNVLKNDNIVTDLVEHKRYTTDEYPTQGVGILIHGDL